jgi:hypothetical protein
MKKDMNLVLKILEFFESRKEISVIKNLIIENYDEQVIKYHLRLMYQANLLVAEEIVSSSTKKRLIDVWPFELTWDGHEFLLSLRNKSVLKKVKSRFGKSISDVPFTILKEVALSIFRNEVGL